ncbi:ABC transporter ATP-binding protein [Acidilutibacter cellobiosedens]|uniref:ABC transporter ATP-binding protein n=1 Tax=Acidilutibacter cellobiosedens TaxID=2507161 RepID=A0A410Q978_9FIRM|nr:ABC transporter ATP-binding protein [Acidilutibacter cellobiosedens]
MIVKKRKREKDKYKNIIRFSKLLIKKNKIQLIIAFILVILTSIMDLILPQFTKYIIDYGIMKKSITLTFKFISLSFIISILSALLNFMLEYLYSIMKNKVTIDLRIKILDHLSKLSGNYYLNIKTGNMLSIIQDDINIIENFDSSLIFSIVANLLTSAVSIVLLVGMKLDLFLMVLVLQVSLVCFLQEEIPHFCKFFSSPHRWGIFDHCSHLSTFYSAVTKPKYLILSSCCSPRGKAAGDSGVKLYPVLRLSYLYHKKHLSILKIQY